MNAEKQLDKVEKESGGRIKFEAYPAMQLGGTPVQLYDQAKDGVVDLTWTVLGYTPGATWRDELAWGGRLTGTKVAEALVLFPRPAPPEKPAAPAKK